jgi:hypothetical protein
MAANKSAIFLAPVFFFFVFLGSATNLYAEGAPFDLTGPKVDVRVQRDAHTLPIAEVPNLQAGDRLWIHPDLPESQSVRYLMVVAFLRGSTNPPPDAWFTRVETWNKPVHEEGVFVTVPEGAEEAVVFLAPETGGAFGTMRSAVRGKPGAFVRAAQDLQQASLDRQRLEKYIDSVRENPADPEQIKTRTTLLARSLNIKLDQQCFDKPSAQQVPCLTQNTDQLVLDDAHSQSMVAALSSGTPSDLLAQVSNTPTARSGYYSAYVGAVVDVVRILSTTHTAQYQYIPALALPRQDNLNLRLNYAPSFRNPKSVLVIALPPVHAAANPPLRAVDAAQVFCLNKPSLVLPAEGAPLVFATDLAHDFFLHIDSKNPPAGIDLPAAPEAAQGGFVINTKALKSVDMEGELSATLRGTWGFRAFEGPRFRLRTSSHDAWIVASKDASALIVGREDTLHLQSRDACCVSSVSLRDEKGKITDALWKIPTIDAPGDAKTDAKIENKTDLKSEPKAEGKAELKAELKGELKSELKTDELEVEVPLQNATPGAITVLIHKYGLREPDEIPLHTYAEAARLDAFTLYAGDSEGILKGTRLDQVTGLEAGGLRFTPEGLSRAHQQDELRLVCKDASVGKKFQAGESLALQITLKDGRALTLQTEIKAPRPEITLLRKEVQADSSGPSSSIHIQNEDDLPQDGRLNFFLKTRVPENFPPSEKIEVATEDESFSVLLSEKDGNLTPQDSKTIFAVLDPMKLLGPSAFGPLKFRAVAADTIDGDWQPLITLVRIPELEGVHCAATGDKLCTLTGEKLFLIDSISTDADFTNPVNVPDGFVESSLIIPQPKGKQIYMKLRDDPSTAITVSLPIAAATQ